MPTLIELAHEHTELEQGAVEHLAALVSEWGMLADFCFADMLLYIPVDKERWLISGQVRAATGQTLYHSDYVNTWASDTERILLDKCIKSDGTVQGEIFVQAINGLANMLAIPVRYEGRIIAVLSRESLARIILEQPILGAKILMELVLMLSQRLRQTSVKLVSLMDKEGS